MNHLQATPALPHSRAGRSVRPEFKVLIEIPTIQGRISSESVAWGRPKFPLENHRPGGSAPAGRRPRRRLKREVKFAACVVFACLPLSFEASRFWSNRLANIAAMNLTRPPLHDDGRVGEGLGSSLVHQVSSSVFEPAVVLMSIEPAQSGITSEAEPPVIFPGYLLPEDSVEEKAHEGS